MTRLLHYQRPGRPGEVWFELCLLHRTRDIPEDVMRMVHSAVMTMPGEREGMMAFKDRQERQEASRKETGAEPVVPKWKLMGFGSLLEYLDHVRREHCYAIELEALKHPEWVQFGFRSARAYRRALQQM